MAKNDETMTDWAHIQHRELLPISRKID